MKRWIVTASVIAWAQCPHIAAAADGDRGAEIIGGPTASTPMKFHRKGISDCGGGKRIISAYYWESKRTATGERFNPRGMTAAHRTLPFGTHLTVENPRTGKTVVVTVNDRGPYTRGVSLDLSLGAAKAIGMQGTGAVCLL